MFEDSLNFQTELLKAMMSYEESKIKDSKIYVPSDEFSNRLWNFFIPTQKINFDFNVNKFTQLEFINNYDRLRFADYFSSIYLKINSEQIFYILPQIHLEILFKVGSDYITDKVNFDNSKFLQSHVISTLRMITFGSNIYIKVIDDKGETLPLDNMLFLGVNEQIIIAFHLLKEPGIGNVVITPVISEEFGTLWKYKCISFVDIFDNKSRIIETKQILYVPVVIYNSMTLNTFVGVEEQEYDFLQFEYLDFRRIIESFIDTDEFYRYLRELIQLKQTTHLFMADQIDQLSIYLEQGKKFFEMGKMPHLMNFVAHSWHDYYMSYLFKKYQSDVYKYLEKMGPKFYNRVIAKKDNIYECYNYETMKGGLMVKSSFGYTFIRYPISVFLIKNKEAVRMAEQVLKPLFAEYSQRVLPRLSDMLVTFNFSFGDIYYIELVPVEMSKSYVRIVEPYVNEMDKMHPIKIKTMLNNRDNSIHSFVLYNVKDLINIFDSDDNKGERYCVNELIYSIFSYNFPEGDNLHQLVSETTDILCPIAKRRYGITQVEIRNIRSKDYHPYQRINSTDLSVVNRKVANKLHEHAVQKGTYKSDDAIQLNKLILNYLSEELKDTLDKCDQSILTHAYLQLEYTEFQRELNRKQRRFDADTDNDYDLLQKIAQEDEDLSKHSLAIKHIIAAILKWWPQGPDDVTSEVWAKLLAIAFVINDSSAILDMANFKLQTHEVYITDFYEIEDNFGDLIYDSLEYNRKIAEQRIINEKEELRVKPLREQLELNSAYITDYGFSLFDMLDILYYLGSSSFEGSKMYPLNQFKKGQLVELILQDNPSTNQEALVKMIDYLSLTPNSYNDFDVIAISNLMRYKERINLCPFICIDDEILYGNQMCLQAFQLWVNYYANGDSPYQKNLPTAIANCVKAIHKEKDMKLEEIAERIAVNVLGREKVEARILNFKRLSQNFPTRPDCGEIDLLAINEFKKIIFVIDAKNVNKRFRPYDIAQEINQFFEDNDSYYSKLSKKVQFISDNEETVLKHFGITHDNEWVIEKAFCVDYVYPSGFIKEEVKFILMEELAFYLKDVNITKF
jgi:hypothetical protein